MDKAIKAAKDPMASDIDHTGTDKVIEAVMKVEPTTEGRWKVRAAVLLSYLDVTAKDLHATHGFDTCTPFCDCKQRRCQQNLTLIKNTRRMLEKV